MTCVSLQNKVKHTKAFIEIQTTKPGSARTLTGLLTTNDSKVIEVAMRNNNTWRENEMSSNCHLQLADKNRLQQSVCCIYVECRNPAMTDAGSIYDVYQPMARCVLFRSVSGRTLQSERALHATSNGAVCTSFDVAGSQSLFLLRRTLRRQSMALLVGEYLYSPVKPFSGIPDPASIATSQTVKKSLRTCNGVGYVNYAPAKSGVGISLPEITRAHNTRLACFFVPHSHTLSMVGCMGAEQSAPGSLVTGKANPVQSATSKISLFCGGNIKPTREDAAMATTPGRSHPDTVKKSLPVSRFGRYIPAAGVNPPAGFSSLNTVAGSRLISDMRFFCARNTTLTRIMAGRDGGALALAGSYSACLLTPLRLATPFSSEVARLHKITVGVINMVNASPCPYPLFIWLFAAVSRADLTDHTPHMVRITAPDELTARRSLVGRYALSFAGRIPAQEVHHA